MNFVATAAIAATVINALLAAFVFAADPRSPLNRTYGLWGASVALWNLSAFFLCQPGTTRADAMNWLRLLQTAVIFLPVIITQLCQIIVFGKTRRWLRWVYLLHAGFALSLAGPWFMRDAQKISVGWWAVAGPLFWVYLISYSALTVPLYVVLPRHAATATTMRRGRIRALWLAVITLGVLGTNDLMPILGLTDYPGTRIPFIPLGNVGAIFYGTAVAYGVLQHQLLDIHIAFSRFAAHAMRLAFLFLTGFLLLLGISIIAPPGAMTSFAFWAALAVLLASGLVASLYIPKLLGGTIDSLERRLLGDHFEYQDKVRAFIENCRWHTDLGGLLDDLHRQLVSTINVKSYAIILLDETNRAFTLMRAHPEEPQRQIANLQSDSPAFQVFASRKLPYLPLGEHEIHSEVRLENEARHQLKSFAGDLVFPLLVESQPLGLLILGEKANGDPFTSTDTQLLLSITENMAPVINHISLKNRMLLNQELDLLGRMSQGMAHDLNNLTTPVWTLLQLLNEGASSDVLRSELAPVAIRNIQTMRDYIKEALFFSENLRPRFEMGRLDELVRGVVEMAGQNNRKGKNIQYHLNTCGEILVEMDHVLIRRLLSNVLANAVDASPKGESIGVEIIPLLKSEPKRDWFRIRITDHGSGIKSEDLDRIFQPYFTTKKTGDEERGFGLGLAICRKIAVLHGGNLVVSSEPGKGTILNLDLPNRQKETMASLISQPLRELRALQAAS